MQGCAISDSSANPLIVKFTVKGQENLKHRILVVDDDVSTRECIAELLASQGYDVSTAEDGLDALLQLTEACPGVVTSDLNIPICQDSSYLPFDAAPEKCPLVSR